MILLKKINGLVNAYGTLEALKIETGQSNYDTAISEDEWNASGCNAYIGDGGRIVLGFPPEQAKRIYADRIRYERDYLLEACDRISPMRWLSMTDNQKQAWIDYRQALLDIPQQDGFPWGGDPEKVPWPVKPE